MGEVENWRRDARAMSTAALKLQSERASRHYSEVSSIASPFCDAGSSSLLDVSTSFVSDSHLARGAPHHICKSYLTLYAQDLSEGREGPVSVELVQQGASISLVTACKLDD